MDLRSMLNCNITTKITANSSLCTHSRERQPATPLVDPYGEFFKFAFGSAIYMIIVSFTTIVANGLLLVVFFFNPLKIFRTATTYFLIGLAFVDILTAASQEPMYATCFIIMYLRHPNTLATCASLLDVGQTISMAAWNASFFIVFAFTVTQYIVVISPLKYGPQVTKTRVVTSVVLIYVYAIFFSLLKVLGVSENIFGKIDLILHSFMVTYITIFFYILLYKAFKKQMAASENIRQGNQNINDRHTTLQRRFIAVNLLLIAILFLTSQPAAILWAIHLYFHDGSRSSPKEQIRFLMAENLLYLKFLLDPFVYAWRIPKYRQALKMVLRCGRDEPETTFNDCVMAKMSKSRETVITFDFKSISPD